MQNSRNLVVALTNNANIGTIDPFCLQGMVRTNPSGSTYDITAGVLFFQAKFYNADPTTVTLGVGQVILGTLTTTNPFVGATADPVTFSDGSVNSVLDFTNVVWSAGTSGTPGTFDYDDLVFLNDKWHEVGATGEPAFENGYAVSSSGTVIGNGVAYRKKYDGKVEFQGGISKTPLTTNDVFTLPTAYRPTYNKSFIAMSGDVGGVNPCVVKITASTGKVNVTPISPSGLGVISFEGLSFYI